MSFTSQDSHISNETFGKDASFKLPQLIGAMSISPAGRDVVLGSREGLHIIDLDSPYSPPRFLPHRTPWEVADVQWSPFADRDYWVVSTSNQKALVWNLNAYGWRDSIEHVLHGHTRAITDINFSAFHPDKLATCAVDSFVHCWDLRSPARPAYSFSDWFAGATQVKWSRQDEHVLASSHDRFLHIWDDRKGAHPLRTIEAHDAKIYGIDWNRFEPSKIVTCSLDRTIKFWDTDNSEDVPERVITTTFPVWRARHTPFGWGLMVMPQRGNGDLHLYDRRDVDSPAVDSHTRPVHVFKGHKGQVKEFLWRAMGDVKNGIDFRDFQLVSWGTDHELRLHALYREVFEDIGHERGVSKPQRLRFTRRGARYRTFRDEPTEGETSLTAPPRADSFPTSNQFLRVRGRPSTNLGMNRVPIAHFRSWLQADKSTRRTDMHGRGTGRPYTDPVSWMKSVKIASWDTDALADELTVVGEKFTKVDFETLNVSQRKAVLSLQCPWGEPDNTPVYLRVDFRFPKGYPREAPAVVNLQKTSSITAAGQKQMLHDIQQITEAYRVRGRGCVECIVRYLLREQDLDHIIAAAMRENLTESRLIDAAEAQFDASDDSEDDQLGPAATMIQPDAQTNVPLAKGCAALWAENGMLVCFFKSTKKEPVSLLNTLGSGDLDEPETSKLFGGFGKFQVTSPSRQARESSRNIDFDSSSGDSDGSSDFSTSSSSSTSSLGFEDQSNFMPWRRLGTESLQRTKSADGSQKSTILDNNRTGVAVSKAVIAIYDMSDLLPVTREAGENYSFGPNMAVAFKHNMDVAIQLALHEAASTWRLAAVMVNQHDDRTTAEVQKTAQSLPSLARASKLPNQLSSQQYQNDGMLFIGEHFLWPSLMQYYEEKCDIQMLATFSAIYLCHYLEVVRTKPEILENMRARFVTNDTNSVAATDTACRANPYSQTFSPPPALTQNAIADRDFSVASNLIDSIVPAWSTSHSQNVSLATSPDSSRLSRQSDIPDDTANVQALGRSRPRSPQARHNRQDIGRLTTSKSLHGSPDDRNTNSSRSMLRSSLSLVNVSTYGTDGLVSKQVARLQPILKNRSDDDSPTKKRRKRLKTRFSCALAENSSILQPYGPHPETFERCLSYICQYLPLLEVWQLWVQRAQLLRTCSQIVALLDKIYLGHMPFSVTIPQEPMLQIRRCCARCEATLEPIEKNGVAIAWQCLTTTCATARVSKPPKKQRCTICETIIQGLSIPCLQCHHLSCYDCAQEWFADVDHSTPRTSSVSSSVSEADARDNSYNQSCPTGCGCRCPYLSKISVPEPQVGVAEVDTESILTPTTPRSEGYPGHQDNDSWAKNVMERRKHRGQSIGGVTETSAVNALLALNAQSRHRSTSPTTTAATTTQTNQEPGTTIVRPGDNSVSVVDELLPWAGDTNPSLARGYGAGLSRGLSNKSSSSTIRRATRKD